MGKGKGKGGCGALDAIGDCIQCIVGTICCLIISGPVLMIIGAVFIASAFDDNRSERIDEFKVAVSDWQNGAVDGFNSAGANAWQYQVTNSCGGQVARTALEQSSVAEDLMAESGETGTFASYERVFYLDDTPGVISQTVNSNQDSCSLNFGLFFQNALIGNLTTPVAEERSIRFDSLCPRTAGDSNSNSNLQRQNQDIERCRSTCRSRGGEPSGSTYNSFECELLEQPKEVCFRVTRSGQTWAVAQGTLPDRPDGASGRGCFLDFPGNEWEAVKREAVTSSSALSVPVRVRSERDPFLYFLDISNGTGDFGLTRGEKLRIGFSLLAIGALIQALVCCACCCICKFARSFASGKKPQRPDNPVGGALYDVSAKYGNYIPGGAALGQPVGQQGGTAYGVPAAAVEKPPQGYPTQGGYTGDASYDTPGNYAGGAPPYAAGGAGGAPPYGGGAGGTTPYGGAPTPYGGAPAYAAGGNAAGPPPAGYPSAV